MTVENLTSREVEAYEIAIVVAELLDRSQYFQVTPLPENIFRVEIKQGEEPESWKEPF